MYPPDGLLTSGSPKRDVGVVPGIIASAPFASDDCLDVYSPVYQFPPLEPEELNTMNPSEDEPSSGLNGRLRPRKSAIPSPLSIKQIVHKYDGKQAQERPKRSSTPSKASPSKPEDLSNNSNLSPTPQLLCPYCDKKFGSKQTVSKHIRRLHLSPSKIETSTIVCLFCNHVETEPSDIIRHMVDSHPNQYFACLDCHTRFPSTKELAEHKLNICEKQKIPYRSKLRRKPTKKSQQALDSQDKDDYTGHGFNGIVISCELKPAHIHDEADIEDNITTNLILPPSKNISPSAVLEKNAVIVLDDIQWNRRIPSNFSFHNTDADQILSRLGVVHRSPKTGESTKKDWFRAIEDATQKFEKCFDTGFYSKVASNVHENLTKFLDGSFNFNPDPDSTIKTRKSKNSVVINTAEGFPILLACEQYCRNTYDGYIPRTIAPKHKWKWDNLENEKSWNPDQIKRDTHANNCIITLVSSLDIWTQLRMRRKFEDKFNITPVEKKTEKQNVISNELKEILESREIPASNSQVTKYISTSLPITNGQDFPMSLGLLPSTSDFNVKPAVLSGEWVRPRCYVCCACGAQSRDSRALSVHVSSKHPHAQVQHYEIVGESLLKADILKHLYVPPNQNINRTRPPRGFRDCTKCMKSITIEDLHQHMLDCAGDTPTVRRKCRYRPFGVRRRRPRLPDNRIRKKMRNDIRTRPSRQKNRMRPKPKIRSEVGDAETIRKMLADLPAKRHRVLVNPLNSILRPRRKLDKQRAMLMMKRHASEDLKNNKPKQSNTTLHFDHQQPSSNNDRYKSISSNRDDEDNKPLKSRLKRVASKITRQKESLNRKAMLKKSKRKVRLLAEKKDTEGGGKDIDTSISLPINVQTDELSVNHNEKRIDVNGDPQNTREHSSGRGDANNGRRDNQHPGCSGQNGNSRNVRAPAQNVPLKHSIARLTANSETHDKSVQFHHLFLVQQECNNTNEHVPTGQRVFFENEAVVTKLDKPPLHFHHNATSETVHEHNADSVQENNLESIQVQTLDSIQKNKLNKPRKGLNDCIAMLKNKLVDADPNATAHVSVQCGTDDLLSTDPALLSTSKLISPRVDVVMKPLQACPSTEQSKKCSKNHSGNDQLPKPSPLYHGQYFNHGMYGHVSNERQSTQWRPVNYEAIMPRYMDNRTRKETSRRRSASQHENLFYAQQLLNVTPPTHNDDMLLQLSAESYNPYHLPPRRSPKNFLEQFNIDSNKLLSKFGRRKGYDKIPTDTSNGSLQSSGKMIHNQNKKSSEYCKKSTRTRVSTPRKPIEALEKHINTRKDIPKSSKSCNEKYRNKLLDYQMQQELSIINISDRYSEDHPSLIKRKRGNTVESEIRLAEISQPERQIITDESMPVDVYIEPNAEHNIKNNTEHSTERNIEHNIEHNLEYNTERNIEQCHVDIEVSIPPAHASTVVEPILSMPLDLSNKALPVDLDYSSRHDPTLPANYESYETLDLSKKRRISMDHLAEDEVVDLRVKHNTDYHQLTVITPTSSTSLQEQNNLNMVQQLEYVPRDLSLKRKNEDASACINLSQKLKVDETEIQDLSKNKMKTVTPVEPLQLDDEAPTDLSNKNVAYVQDTTLTSKAFSKNETDITVTMCEEHVGQQTPNDLSGSVDNEKPNECNTQILTEDTCLTPEEDHNKTQESVSYEHEKPETSDASISCSNLSQIQKPIYDPTLRIPQFKIRPLGTESNSRETNVKVPPVSTIATCTESYSPHQFTINSPNSSSQSHSSTVMASSVIASIEAQERITYSFTKSILNTAVTCATGSLPAYSLLNRGISTPFTTFESTRPVYALPNACISMAKIDITTNSLLSIPSTTIVSTSPVYTLAGTTMVTPLNYVTLPNNGQSIPYPPPCGSYLPEIDNQMMTQYTSPSPANMIEGRPYDSNILIRGAVFNYEREQEISSQLAMLPKEIVAILKTMSLSHRTQLLDVLSNYLSSSRPIPILSTQSPLFQNAVPSILTLPIRRSREIAVDASTDTKDIKPLYSLSTTIKDSSRLKRAINSSSTSLSSSVKHTDSDFNNQIIDLTYDEIVPKIDLDSEVNDGQQMLPAEEMIPSVAPPPQLQKTSNDKTASLRAVRIKAPSERQQLKIISNHVEIAPCLDVPVVPCNFNLDSDSQQSLLNDISAEIQMYEVSSTQSSKSKLSETEISYKAPNKSVGDNVTKSLSGVTVSERGEDCQLQLANTGPVGTIPSIKSIICQEIKDNSSIPDIINLNNNNDIVGSIESVLNESKENGIVLSGHKLHEPQVTYNPNENDDDSDDDISLAVIVQQKLQDQNKLKVLHLDIESKQPDNIISSDALILKDNNKVEVDMPTKDSKKSNINEPSLNISKLGHKSKDKNKTFKKKGKKNSNDISSLKKLKIQDMTEKKVIEFDLRDKNDHTIEIVEDEKSNFLKPKSQQQDKSLLETTIVLLSEEANSKENTTNQCTPTISESRSDSHKDLKYNDGNKVQNKVDDVDLKATNKNISDPTQKPSILESLPQDEIYGEYDLSILEKIPEKESCNVQEVNICDEIDGSEENMTLNKIAMSNDATNTFEEKDIGLPLRRSKRGKSLFMDGNEQTLIYTDTCFESKTPLTKKQLIFSKLLLDEEKNLKNLATVDDNQTLLEENRSCLEINTNKGSEDKNKSVKRKKSPHSKRKSKKKKSVDNSKFTDSDDDIAKPIVKKSSQPEQDCDSKNTSDICLETLNPDLSCQTESHSEDAHALNKLETDNIKELTSYSSNITASAMKRKIESSSKNQPETNIHSPKPKKSKSSKIKYVLEDLHTDTVVSDKNNQNLPLAARRARSKSFIVKSSGSMLYDPYDIDLEDMGDETEPFRKQKCTLLRPVTKLPKENQQTRMPSEITQSENNLNDITIETEFSKDFPDHMSDSDESSKSDVPLKKYVEEKERKNQLCASGTNKNMHKNTNAEDTLNSDDLKHTRKKHKKNKRSFVIIDDVRKEDKDDKEVSEEQRSEQFMESFGFFSERKPRKSNLLATKKISETFHIIANESDDVYLNAKERHSKKSSRSESKKAVEEENNAKCNKTSDSPKSQTKCDKNLKRRSATLYCHLCKQEFRRIDNLVRHQLTLLHASKLSETPLKIKTPPLSDDRNYLVVFKEHLDRLNMLEQKMKSKKQNKSKFTFPPLREILDEVRKSVREQQLARRNLSRDQALFLDCCELLKDSNRGQIEDRNLSRPFFPCCPNSYALACTNAKEYDPNSGLSLEFSKYNKCDPNSSNLAKKPIIHTSARLLGMPDFVPLSSTSKQASNVDPYAQPSTSTSGFVDITKTGPRMPTSVIEEITDEKEDSKSEGDVDSITAQNILESEEVRNLENDLISGLKEAACKFQPLLSGDNITPINTNESCPEAEIDNIPELKESTSKVKSLSDSKEKKNLDIIENIDIFEDKFDKIKRKCRSQAAAAKLVQTTVEPSTSHKSRKKSDKKKGKRNSKKYNQNTVLTKGALKGYDSIKVSILTSDIDMSAIVPPITPSSKKKKKRSSKKKRDRKNSILARKLDTVGSKESSHKDIDVYEFLDNEEPEIFELRPSTVMERFRNLNKKDMLNSSNREDNASSDSVSDGDDFVYMSDDYVCSDDETENSLMSCELGIVKGSHEVKKSFSPLKRKDVMEKNAVMGKIFKHNAVRSEKKNIKPKEISKPKANLDQLFDSLLEEEPNSSALNDADSPKRDSSISQKKRVFSPIVLSKYDVKATKNNDSSKKHRSPSPGLSSDSAVSRRISSFSSRQSSPRRLSSSRYDVGSPFDYEPSTSKRYDDTKKYDRNSKDFDRTPTKKYDFISDLPVTSNVNINDDLVIPPESDKIQYNKIAKDKSLSKRKEKTGDYEPSYDFKADYYDDDAYSDDAGVARQRARRKCTVGKQNILAETWSSESELDGVPPRPNSAESVVMNVSRKRKGKKKDGQLCGGRKGNKHVSVKKQDFESRVSSSNRNSGACSGAAGGNRPSGGSSTYTQQLSLPGPSGIGPRLRPTSSFWADGDEEPEHVQQHGWIVGDSHKKLVTMLAHAKGRKRNNDDKVRLME